MNPALSPTELRCHGPKVATVLAYSRGTAKGSTPRRQLRGTPKCVDRIGCPSTSLPPSSASAPGSAMAIRCRVATCPPGFGCSASMRRNFAAIATPAAAVPPAMAPRRNASSSGWCGRGRWWSNRKDMTDMIASWRGSASMASIFRAQWWRGRRRCGGIRRSIAGNRNDPSRCREPTCAFWRVESGSSLRSHGPTANRGRSVTAVASAPRRLSLSPLKGRR